MEIGEEGLSRGRLDRFHHQAGRVVISGPRFKKWRHGEVVVSLSLGADEL